MPVINDPNVIFCNMVWKDLQKQIKKVVSKEIWKESWYYLADGKEYRDAEFHVPSENFYWHGEAWCVSECKTKGWLAYLYHKGIELES
jgi:hypothetical protein